jgi:DNA-binding PadR family transcriptional regulator
MAAREKARFAILGLLSWRPLSGYDIKKMVELGLSHFWSESYGQLYPTLNALVAQGLVEPLGRGVGRRGRLAYQITARGRAIFEEWVTSPTESPRTRSEFLLKFFVACRVGRDHGLRLLDEFREQQQRLRDDYAASEHALTAALDSGVVPDELAGVVDADSRDQLLIFLLTLRQGLRVVEARLAWCDDAVALLHRERRRTSRESR